MSDDDQGQVLGSAKGTIKYDGLCDNKKGWLSGTLMIRRDPKNNSIKLYISYKANRLANTPPFLLSVTTLEKVTGFNECKRILIKLHDNNGTTITIKDGLGNPLDMKNFHDCLKKIQSGEINSTPESMPYLSHSDTVLKTPNRTYEAPAAKSTPKSDHKYNKENASQGSERKFTSVKSRSDDNERTSHSQHGERETDRSSHFLEKAKEKSRETLDLQPSVKKFYGKDSDVHTSRPLYGSFGMSSIKRGPGLLTLSSAHPMPKKARLSDHATASARNYTWGKTQASTSFQTQAAGLQGFSNLGNTCYMNAILQALFNLETFSADIQNENLHRKMPNNENLFKSLALLLRCKKAQVSIEKRRAALRQVKSAISTTAKRFSGYEQHDAHEFLNQVLDQLKEEIIQASKPPPHLDDDQENVPVQELLLNPTSMNFEFEIIHTITCQGCGVQVTKVEQFVDLSVDMPKKYKNSQYPLSLQDALDNFLRKEMIEYKCEECGHKRSEVTHKFAKLPRVLILHLKRYSYNTLAANYKTAQAIGIPKFIALEPHCEEQTSPPQPPSIHMTPQKRPPSHKPMKLDATDGVRRRVDLDPSGRRMFTFKKARILTDSDDDFEKKPPVSKSRADVDAYRSIQESLKEKQKIEEAERREDRELREALAESLKQEMQKKSVAISDLKPGRISESQLEKMTEEEQILYALNQSSLETGAPFDDENDGFKRDKNVSDVSSEDNCPISGGGGHRGDLVKSGAMESDSDHHLTRLEKTSSPGREIFDRIGELMEHAEYYSEDAVEDFLITVGRPASPRESDSDKEDSSSEEVLSGDTGGLGDNSPSSVSGADSNVKHRVQNVTVRINNGPGGDAALFFAGDLDDSILLENDEHSDQSHGEKGGQGLSEKELVVISSAEDNDVFNCRKTMVKSEAKNGDVQSGVSYDFGTSISSKKCKSADTFSKCKYGDPFSLDSSKKSKSGNPFSWDSSKSLKSEKPREFTHERLTLNRQGKNYSKSEQKFKETKIGKSFDRRAFSAQKPRCDRLENHDIWDDVISIQKKPPAVKNRFLDFSHTGNSKSKGFDVTDGLASSRKKEPEDKHVASESSSDEEQKGHWKSFDQPKKRSLSGGNEKPRNTVLKSYTRYPQDEVDLSCPDEDELPSLTASQPKEGCSAPKLTPPSPGWLGEFARENEDKQLAAALEKSRTDTGHAVTDFDEEEIQRAIEKSLLEGIEFLPPDTETDENDNEVEVEKSEEELKILWENAEKGDRPYSYQLTSVVCHLGSSSSAGHYVSDVYDIRKQMWFSYDDSRVHNTNEEDVRASRKKTGYIFFYMNKDAVEELNDFYSKRNEKSGQSKPSSKHSV